MKWEDVKSVEEDIDPNVFVADEAFPLAKNMMRPFPGKKLSSTERIFNYRLSRARRVVENAFGILAARFRVYHRTIEQRPETVDKIIKASCVLHNMLQKDACANPNYEPSDLDSDENLGAALQPLASTKGQRSSHEAFNIRNAYRDYFNSQCGQVPWQNNL